MSCWEKMLESQNSGLVLIRTVNKTNPPFFHPYLLTSKDYTFVVSPLKYVCILA